MAGIVQRVRAITEDNDYASQVTSLITELNLTDNEAKKVFRTLDREELQRELPLVKAFQELAKYQGFNPREILKLLVEAHERSENEGGDPDSIDFEVMVDGQVVKKRFTSKMPFHQDMEFICLMFVTRGAAFDKIQKKSTEAMVSIMNLLKVKYNINTVKRRPGISLDARTITIPRIAASFPGITVGLFHHGLGRMIVDGSALFPDCQLPRAIFAPMMASMIPSTLENPPLAILLCMAVKIDNVLHQTDNKTGLMSLYQYMMASVNSTAFTDRYRTKCCADWGVIVRDNGGSRYVPGVLACRQRAKEIISQSRPNDTNLMEVLNKV